MSDTLLRWLRWLDMNFLALTPFISLLPLQSHPGLVPSSICLTSPFQPFSLNLWEKFFPHFILLSLSYPFSLHSGQISWKKSAQTSTLLLACLLLHSLPTFTLSLALLHPTTLRSYPFKVINNPIMRWSSDFFSALLLLPHIPVTVRWYWPEILSHFSEISLLCVLLYQASLILQL